jgi:hypothetical protein
MEPTIPGKTKCKYLEGSTPVKLENYITEFLKHHVVLDIKYHILPKYSYGAFLIYLDDENSTTIKYEETSVIDEDLKLSYELP